MNKHAKIALDHLTIAVEELRQAHLEKAPDREHADIARAMFHLGSAHGVLQALLEKKEEP